MIDPFGRTVDYLRVSVTDRCNFRCGYCAPNGHGQAGAPMLGMDEIAALVRAAVAQDITKIRLTGGEPLVRRDIVEIVRAIAAIAGVRDLSLTTNGFLLERLARPLTEAGLQRVNVSLDSLRPDVFARIVGQDAFARVWDGILAAEAAGLTPLKLNVVMLRGLNDDEAPDFARLTLEHAWHVRLIELMPVGASEAARAYFSRHFISAREVRAHLPSLRAVDSPTGNGPARTYQLPGALGTIGFITPASEHFCAACNRLRLTARGALRSCLFSDRAVETRGAPVPELPALLREAVRAKPLHHPLGEGFTILAGAMAEIGG
jgi:cyclic pyranopterin phosphate synthase